MELFPVMKPFRTSKNAHQDHPAIVLRDVDKVYENAAGKFVALKSVNMQLNYGQFISIVGKSGCWKIHLAEHDHGHRPPNCR